MVGGRGLPHNHVEKENIDNSVRKPRVNAGMRLLVVVEKKEDGWMVLFLDRGGNHPQLTPAFLSPTNTSSFSCP